MHRWNSALRCFCFHPNCVCKFGHALAFIRIEFCFTVIRYVQGCEIKCLEGSILVLALVVMKHYVWSKILCSWRQKNWASASWTRTSRVPIESYFLHDILKPPSFFKVFLWSVSKEVFFYTNNKMLDLVVSEMEGTLIFFT